jgi:SET domain-containing protein
MKLYKIRKSKIDNKGRGLYATKDITEGTKIINYLGKIITNKEVEESDKYDNKKPIYLFTLNKKYTLDGDFSFNIAGLVNHSCDANARYDGKGLKIWITADRDIKKDEEITCDYGFSFDKKDYKQFPCKCRSKNCCGFIIREESRWRIHRKFAMGNKKKLINNSR